MCVHLIRNGSIEERYIINSLERSPYKNTIKLVQGLPVVPLYLSRLNPLYFSSNPRRWIIDRLNPLRKSDTPRNQNSRPFPSLVLLTSDMTKVKRRRVKSKDERPLKCLYD